MTKHQCRENAFLLLFEASFRDDTPEELYSVAEEIAEIGINDNVKKIVEGVISHTDEIDGIIASYSTKRAVNRIPRINLIILRMAIYELLNIPETPVNVVVSEAVGLSEIYAIPEDTSFINGVLGAYVRTLPPRTTKQETE
ncbi:MAG TPA: transcription antitermination factor NusB [Ruminococcus sp.]|jgi:N utilization substance protein B|nr:transcription antitermination factor NusB [Ruminococcus sp.]